MPVLRQRRDKENTEINILQDLCEMQINSNAFLIYITDFEVYEWKATERRGLVVAYVHADVGILRENRVGCKIRLWSS